MTDKEIMRAGSIFSQRPQRELSPRPPRRSLRSSRVNLQLLAGCGLRRSEASG